MVHRPQPITYLAKKFDVHRVVGTIMIFALLLVPAAYFIQRNFQDDNARQTQQSIDRGYVSCLQVNDTRTVLATVVKGAYDGNRSLDFTKIPSFAKLDASTRQFFADLAALTSSQPDPVKDPNSTRNKLLGKLKMRDCPREFPTHSRGLSINTPANVITKTG